MADPRPAQFDEIKSELTPEGELCFTFSSLSQEKIEQIKSDLEFVRQKKLKTQSTMIPNPR